MGSIRGNVSKSRPIESTNMPRITYKIATENITQTTLSLTSSICSASQVGRPLRAKNFVRKIVPIKIMKILPVPLAVADRAYNAFERLNFPLSIARIVAKNAPTAPDSVGVKNPPNIPPKTKNIRVGRAHTSFIASHFS